MWATPVIQVNYSGFSGEGQESARNLRFLGVIWRTAMPHNRLFTDGAELNILIERTQSCTNVIL